MMPKRATHGAGGRGPARRRGPHRERGGGGPMRAMAVALAVVASVALASTAHAHEAQRLAELVQRAEVLLATLRATVLAQRGILGIAGENKARVAAHRARMP